MNSPSFLRFPLRKATLTQLSRWYSLFPAHRRWKKCGGWSFGFMRHRLFTTEAPAASSATKKLTIPDPTWSVASLQLDKAHPPASVEELHVLAQRATLDMCRLDDATRNKLCQDLGNMLRMIEHVQENDPATAQSEIKTPMDPVDLYDVPRGVVAAPFRDEDDRTQDERNDEEKAMAQSVRNSFLEPKMRWVGGHQYYEIVTSSAKDATKQ
jgi:Asp-tRNA(Asn)/Glu-tRNA(Gln) amidotransferase C subunit